MADGHRPELGYAFGPFVVDAVKRILWRDGEVVALTSKAFDILLTLIEYRDRVVEKDDFLREVWRGAAVEENNLVRNVSTLRKALNEGPSEHKYIVTVPGRGYRFVADVEVREPPPRPAEPPSAEPQPSPEAIPNPVALAAEGGVRNRTWLMIAAVALVSAVAAMILLKAPTATDSSRPRRIWQLTFDQGLQGEPTWSPDGRMVAYSSDRGGNLDVWVQALAGGDPIQITNSEAHDWQPNWSADGRFLAFRSERDGGGLYVVPSLGGRPQRVSTFGYHPQWSPDGAKILFHRSNSQGLVLGSRELYVVTTDGQPPQKVIGPLLQHFSSFTTAWHPDSQRVSLWGIHSEHGLTFWTVGTDGGTPVQSEIPAAVQAQLDEASVRFTNADNVPMAFAWAPTGDALYFEGNSHGVRNIWRMSIDPSSLEWRGSPDRLTTGADLNAELALAPGGGALAFAVRNERVRLWSFPFDATAGRLLGDGQPLTSMSVDALSPEISPNGAHVVFNAEQGGRRELRVKSLKDGRERVLLAADTSTRWTPPRWAPDSAHVIFRRTIARGGREKPPQSSVEIVILPIDGGGERILSALNGQLDFPFDWSTDGTWILGGTQRAGRYTLGLFGAQPREDGQAHVRMLASDSERTLWQARLSPDQEWISFAAAKPGVSQIFTLAASGGEQIAITEGTSFDDRPRWSPDSRTLYFLSNRTGFFNVWGRRVDPHTGLPHGESFPVTAFNSPGHMIPPRMVQLGLAVAADRVIVPIAEATGNIWILEGLGR